MSNTIFLTLTYQLGFSENYSLYKNISYINDCLGDFVWQKNISQKFIVSEKGYDIFISVCWRFFNKEGLNLKSYAKFKSNQELVIDPIFLIEKYKYLPEEEMRKKLCDDIFEIFTNYLIKYKKRFVDFNVDKFLPILQERLTQVKKCEIPFYRDYDVIFREKNIKN